MFYIYVFMLLVIIFVVTFSFKYLIKLPKKIKVLSITAFIILFLRYAALLILLYSSRITYLYNLKYSFFAHLCGIPMLILIVLYIIIRNNRLNFSYLYLLAGMFISTYIGIILKNEVVLAMFSDYKFGYYMHFKNQYIMIYYAAVNLVAIMISLSMIYGSNDKKAVCLSNFAALVSVSEVTAMIMGIMLMPQYLFGELLWVVLLLYLITKIKRR